MNGLIMNVTWPATKMSKIWGRLYLQHWGNIGTKCIKLLVWFLEKVISQEEKNRAGFSPNYTVSQLNSGSTTFYEPQDVCELLASHFSSVSDDPNYDATHNFSPSKLKQNLSQFPSTLAIPPHSLITFLLLPNFKEPQKCISWPW